MPHELIQQKTPPPVVTHTNPSSGDRRQGLPSPGSPWYEKIMHLRANPGVWFLIGEDMTTSTYSYLKRRYGLTITGRGHRRPEKDPGIKSTRFDQVYAKYDPKNTESKNLPAQPQEPTP